MAPHSGPWLHRRGGFTLVELSIVLVIVALVTGGVLVGQALVRQAEMRSLKADIDRFRVATNTFKAKFGCVPGDCANATAFFPATTNGNGNGFVNAWWVDGNCESMYLLQQLASAGLISGTYDPAGLFNGCPTGAQGLGSTPSRMVPRAAFDGNLRYYLFHVNPGLVGVVVPASVARAPVVQAGAVPLINSDFLWGSGLKADAAYGLDLKYDDGKPLTGRIAAGDGQASENNPGTVCLSGDEYAAANADSGCILYFRLD